MVSERQVKDLPLNGRSYDQLLTLNPGVVNYTSQRAGGIGTSNSVVGNMFAVSGRRPQENLYLLNGVEFTSASEVNNTPGGTSGQLLGVDAVREFAVVKDTYGAEYGKRPGAQINIVTASGTNQFHGNAYEFLRNSALDARNFFDQAQIPDFERNEFGGSLGGPVKKDKTFLFANYEGFRQILGLSDRYAGAGRRLRGPRRSQRSTSAGAVARRQWPGTADLRGEQRHRQGIQQSLAAYSRGFWHRAPRPGSRTRIPLPASTPWTTANPIHPPATRSALPTSSCANRWRASAKRTSFLPTYLTGHIRILPRRLLFQQRSHWSASGAGRLDSCRPAGRRVVVGGGTTLNGASQITNGGTNAGSNLSAVRNLFTAADQVSITHGKHLINAGTWFERLQVERHPPSRPVRSGFVLESCQHSWQAP